MTLMEQIITIVICIVCVQFTRLLPFWIFSRQSPDSGICSLPRQSTTSRDVWDVSGVLL